MNMTKIREGYKETEIGVIPEEWEVKSLNDVTKFIKDGSHGSHTDVDDGIPLLSAKDIINNKVQIPIDCRRISQSDYDKLHKNYELQVGDVLLTIVGTIGRTAIIDSIEDKFTFQRSVGILRPNELTEPQYLKQFFNGIIFQKQLKNSVNASAQGGVYLNTLSNLTAVIPPLQEQQRIAEILSTTDEHIEKLDKTIEDYQLLKKGMMKKLLTEGIGHIEFKETEIGRIPKEWKVKLLKQYSWYQEGPGLRKWQFTSEGIKVINVTNLVDKFLNLSLTDRHISIEEYEKKYKHFSTDSGDIVVASSGNSWGKVSIIREQDLPLLMNTSVIRFKPKDDLLQDYLYQYLMSNLFNNQIKLMITGSAQPNFGPFHLDRTLIALPPLSEQKRISTILSELDNRINLYQKEREDFIQLKIALMEQLLTGKIRVNQ